MVKDQHYRYPRVNRAHFKPNFVKKDRDDQIDLGWAEGVFSDGRPLGSRYGQQHTLDIIPTTFR